MKRPVAFSSHRAQRAWVSNMSHRIADQHLLHDALDLLNPWQRDFPLVSRPFLEIAKQLSWSERDVIDSLITLKEKGAFSRIGAVFAPEAGGASLLAAMAVPTERLDEVAHQVSSQEGVNHNYEREHRFNLWFVMSAASEGALEESLSDIEDQTGIEVLRLRMIKPYHIDLGFDLKQHQTLPKTTVRDIPAQAITETDRPLAGWLEEGLPLIEEPYQQLATQWGKIEAEVIDRLSSWTLDGTMKRFGIIVRHHEFGFHANAMTVFDVPDDQVDAYGQQLARYPGVTLAYRRTRAAQWPYNLYCMVHGKDRTAVLELLAKMTVACGLGHFDSKILFSLRRFKQMGARRFQSPVVRDSVHSQAGHHAL